MAGQGWWRAGSAPSKGCPCRDTDLVFLLQDWGGFVARRQLSSSHCVPLRVSGKGPGVSRRVPAPQGRASPSTELLSRRTHHHSYLPGTLEQINPVRKRTLFERSQENAAPQKLLHGNHCQGDRALRCGALGTSIRQANLGEDAPEVPLSLCFAAPLLFFSTHCSEGSFLEISSGTGGKVPRGQHRHRVLA